MKASDHWSTAAQPVALGSKVLGVRVAFLLGLFLCFPLGAAVIDFEVINGSVPREGLAISNQFAPHYGVSFRRADGSFPAVARKGLPRSAFFARTNGVVINDEIDPTNPLYDTLGDSFLTDDGWLTNNATIYLDFSAPVAQAGGYFLDVDGQDQMTITAYSDFGTNQLQTIIVQAGDPNTGDGSATQWSFTRATNDIRHIRIAVTSATGGNVGHDNFSSSFTPAPQQTTTVELNTYAGLTVKGDVGRPYRIDYADALAPSNWIVLTNLVLPVSPFFFYDRNSTNQPKRFYRVTGTAGTNAVLDFETIGGLVPLEGTAISNQFVTDFGVSFRRGTNGFPVLARRGTPPLAYPRTNLDDPDTINPADPRAGEFGDFFLTDDGALDNSATVHLDFTNPVAHASGYVLDLDGADQVSITAYSDFGTNELGTIVITAGDPETGSGRSTPWSFNRPANDIQHIEFLQTGTASANVAHDNFSSSFEPPPQATAELDIHWFAGVTVTGDVGRPYGIQYAEPATPTNWITLTNIFLPTSPFLLMDTTSTNTAARHYRAVSLP